MTAYFFQVIAILALDAPDPSGEISCKWIIGILITGITALAGYVVKLHNSLSKEQNSRVEYMEGQLRELRELRDEVRRRGGNG